MPIRRQRTPHGLGGLSRGLSQRGLSSTWQCPRPPPRRPRSRRGTTRGSTPRTGNCREYLLGHGPAMARRAATMAQGIDHAQGPMIFLRWLAPLGCASGRRKKVLAMSTESLRIQCALIVQEHQPNEARRPDKEEDELSVDRGFADLGQSARLTAKLVKVLNWRVPSSSPFNSNSHVVASESTKRKSDTEGHRQELKPCVHLKGYRSPESHIDTRIKNRRAKAHGATTQRHA